MIKAKLTEDLRQVLKELNLDDSKLEVVIPPKPELGDYSTNIALQQANRISDIGYQTSEEIANKIVTTHPLFESRVKSQESSDYIEKIEVSPNGFINFFIQDEFLIADLAVKPEPAHQMNGQKILIEYGHVNLLKEVHIGHLRTFILGESLARILKYTGAEVFRANYQGDIGLHIAKAVWGIKKLGWPSEDLNSEEKAEFLGRAYTLGNTDYETPQLKSEIDQINTDLYQKESDVWSIYQLACRWSLEYLEPIYQSLGIKYDGFFFESDVAQRGKQLVLENLGQVFTKSEGAIIFKGEPYGLHTRVFLTNKDLPTYEAKELGLAEAEYQKFPYDRSIHVVASEQLDYLSVVFKAIEMIKPDLKDKKYHLSYGLVDLKEGKMSSRTGNIISYNELSSKVRAKIRQAVLTEDDIAKISLSAIKFAYLKFSPEPNMTFDLEESVSLRGDSGPYVQYTYIRTESILRKRQLRIKNQESRVKGCAINAEERGLLIKLGDFDEVVGKSALGLRPNLICTYLVELSHLFNQFYQKNQVLGGENENLRLELTQKVGQVLKIGLDLLGIEVPERM